MKIQLSQEEYNSIIHHLEMSVACFGKCREETDKDTSLAKWKSLEIMKQNSEALRVFLEMRRQKDEYASAKEGV